MQMVFVTHSMVGKPADAKLWRAGRQGCKYFVVPKTRTKFWLNKIAAYKTNDEKAVKALRKDGWKIITVWECQLKSAKVKRTLFSLIKKIF